MLIIIIIRDEDELVWFFRGVLYGQMNLGHTIQMKHIFRGEMLKEALNPRSFGRWFLAPFPLINIPGPLSTWGQEGYAN